MTSSSTTGSVVVGCVPGLRNHLGGGLAIVYLIGDPSATVNPVAAGNSPSGATVGYRASTDQLYQCTVGSTWIKLGSVA